MDNIQIKQARAQLLKGSRLFNEGYALWNNAADRIARRMSKNLDERNTYKTEYFFEGKPYSLLDITCEAKQMYGSSYKGTLIIEAYFVVKDFIYNGLTDVHPTKKEAELLKEIQGVLLKRREAYDEGSKKALLEMAIDTQGTSWHGLKSLKNSLEVIRDFRWELEVEDFISGELTVDTKLSTGEKRLGNTMTI